MAASSLRQLLAVVKALILASKRLAKETWVRLLRKLALLWRLLLSRLRLGTRRTSSDRKKPDPSYTPHVTPSAHDSLEKPTTITPNTDEQKLTFTTTPTTAEHKETIPLDSSISCSLHPYPYLNHSLSRTSLNDGLNAARSAHSIAVSSRNASRSSQQLAASPDTQSFQDGYTFTVKSPDHPLSPTGTRRQYSLSSPQLGSGSGSDPAPNHDSGAGYDAVEIELVRRTPSSSPAESMFAHPAGVVPSGCPSVNEVNLGHDRIFPIAPEFFQRYERTKFAKNIETKMTIKAMTLDFRPHPDPPGWKPIVHPEGILYFYNEEKKTVTEANLYDTVYYEQITSDIATLEDHIRSNYIRLPEHYTLAMDLNMQSHEEIFTDYYYADHDRKVIFFLDDLDTSTNLQVWNQVKGVTSLAHVRHELEAQYWSHGMLYPSTVQVTEDAVADLRDVILHYIGDATTSRYSTSPYNLPDLYQMLGQVNSLEKNAGPRFQGASSLLCRLMWVFSRQRFYNWHGLPEARIYRDQSVHGKKLRHKTLLIKVLSPLLFSAPDVHLKSLEKMWVDGIMHGAVWLESIKKLNDEWQEFILYATVLLNANVAFLAIQSIDRNEPDYRSPVQVASYLSTVASIGSVILGLLLLRQNRTKANATADDVCAFLTARSHATLGLETLAILYSLPYALLLWGMVSFLAAFAWNCFDTSNIATRTIMGAAWVAFAVLVLWCVWMGWVKYEHDDVPDGGDGEDAENTTGGNGSSASQHSGASTKERASRPGSRASRAHEVGATGAGGVIQTLTKPLWRWPMMLFFPGRRQSYDSQKTVV
ncbi:hypothetical protein DFP72DRAFT_416920 [Ephemerocybe angulata]|uniref:Uncharacterized protein n=1 Tax=Ephemerocybe angulata TaxID=980116 RepID=A0A8H6MCJ3_9AGAR|nr:hypothetical protein DFP72DRAFT_416920 [Tulosesus angulatus]